jgi:glucose-1-phosphate adenylyltransferase
MGVYVFRRDVLWQALEADAEDEHSAHDFGRDVLPSLLAQGADVYGYLFPQYWQDVGTIDAFYAANLALLADRPPIDLSDPDWVIHTAILDLPAVRLGNDARVERSLIANGARIDGRVVRSVISPGVVVESGAEIVDSILMNDTRVLPGARVERAILDKQVWVGQGARVEGGSGPANRVCPDHLHGGLALVGKGATIPDGITVGANARIDPDVAPEDFEGDVGAGEVVWNPRVAPGAQSHGHPGGREKAALSR